MLANTVPAGFASKLAPTGTRVVLEPPGRLNVLVDLLAHYNYWVVIALMMLGMYVVMANPNLVKKVVGLNIFQTAVFIFYISLGEREGATAPILDDAFTFYVNPLPHVLILTAIVVSVATFLKIVQDSSIELEDVFESLAFHKRAGLLASNAAGAEHDDGLVLECLG